MNFWLSVPFCLSPCKAGIEFEDGRTFLQLHFQRFGSCWSWAARNEVGQPDHFGLHGVEERPHLSLDTAYGVIIIFADKSAPSSSVARLSTLGFAASPKGGPRKPQ
jgi:hypothetical protein